MSPDCPSVFGQKSTRADANELTNYTKLWRNLRRIFEPNYAFNDVLVGSSLNRLGKSRVEIEFAESISGHNRFQASGACVSETTRSSFFI
jgi:hypothetical protein